MARGQSQAADKQLALTNSIGADERTRQKGLEDKLIPGYSSLMKSGYLSPEEAAAAEVSEMGTATQPFESMGFEAANRAARTGNAADLTAQQDQLALEEGRTANQAAAGLQNEKMRNQMAGMYGLSGLRAEDLNSMNQMYGLGPGTLQARAAGESGDQAIAGFGNMGANLIKAFKENPNSGGSCWIAEALYGDDQRVHLLSYWLNHEYPQTGSVAKLAMRLYAVVGERVAGFVRKGGIAKRLLAPLFAAAMRHAEAWAEQ